MTDMIIREISKADLSLVTDFFAHLDFDAQMFFNHQHGNEKWLLGQLDDPKKSRVDFASIEKNDDGTEIMTGLVFLFAFDTLVPWVGICLREGCRGKHLGRTLLQHAEDYAKAHGCGGLVLTTHSANIRAQTLYRNFGFVYQGIFTSGEYLYIKSFPRLTSDGTSGNPQ